MASHFHRKRLAGIEATPSLQTLWRQAMEIMNQQLPTIDGGEENNVNDINVVDINSTGSRSSSNSTNGVRPLPSPLTTKEAVSILQEFQSSLLPNMAQESDLPPHPLNNDENTSSACTDCSMTYLPIPVVRAMESIFREHRRQQRCHPTADTDYLQALSAALRSTSLVFTTTALPNPDRTTDPTDDAQQRIKFRQRMERLRLQHEEARYAKLTRNIAAQQPQDDVTVKSMTYAASIGLNMIVAPISFGVFMYFFAGSLLEYVWPSPHPTATSGSSSSTVDIKKVIAGVVSGVLMLFIEMILFVIRTHEMDAALRKKKRKQARHHPSPFGHYTATTEKSYRSQE
jgi:Endoplasmic reticulum-based factor for assembly of V-ATPase